jgi:hypothetical protein
LEKQQDQDVSRTLEINNSGVVWEKNRKAFIIAATMEEQLNMFNAKMKMENRNCILFLDNATCQPRVTLSNVKISWFSANATSVLQPMHMGVICKFK